MIVFDRVRMPIEPMRDRDAFVCDIDALHVADEKAHVPQHLADRVDDIGQIEIARRDLVQHRGEEEEVLATDKSHFEIRKLKLLKLQRGIKSAEAAAENEDASFVCHAPFVGASAEYLQSGALQPGIDGPGYDPRKQLQQLLEPEQFT